MLISISNIFMKNLILLCFSILVIIIIYHYITGRSGTFKSPSQEFIWNFLGDQGHEQMVSFKSKGEKTLCTVMGEIFKKPFRTHRPHFLTSPITGRQLELDCYNEELKIAAEYNGRQHYRYTPKFHKSYSEFRESQYRDLIKKYLCQEHGIKLIVVPYTISEARIKEYILKQL